MEKEPVQFITKKFPSALNASKVALAKVIGCDVADFFYVENPTFAINQVVNSLDPTSDVRFMVYIGRTPGKDTPRAAERTAEFGNEVIRQFTQDIHIWSHQRYSDPPALATAEYEGFTAIRKWAMQFYPEGLGGSAADLALISKADTI